MLPFQMLMANEFERREQLRLSREENRFLRDRSDPFGLTDERFISLFRLNKQLVIYLFDELNQLAVDRRSTGIPFHLRILCALRFFSTGHYQRGVGQEYILSVSQQTISRCVAEVAAAIEANLGNNWIKFSELLSVFCGTVMDDPMEIFFNLSQSSDDSSSSSE
ncbi:hypothetical protein NQ315_007961 [Exocentrus adspersus]|uniref:Nuclease HARBI1 n=1 Tax=Exocentrus adspersus TaxID=1586481 RepID=A0AAV8V7E4_9CUCU|nr:hypothetical protein NQ315_007961 [Exocentrus adspersus]